MDITRFLPINEYNAAVGANSPSALNPFATMNDLSGFVTGNMYTANGTVGAGRVATITDTLTFQGGTLITKGSGNTSGTSNFLAENLAGTELFRIKDDGSVSSKNGYWIDGGLFLHMTANGVQDASKKNTSIGLGSAPNIINGTNNVAIGYNSLPLLGLTVGSNRDNLALGSSSSNTMRSGQFNIHLGASSGGNIIDGNSTIAIGWGAGAKTSGNYVGSIAFGREALFTGNNQVVFGSNTYHRNYYFGRGVEQTTLDGAGVNFNLTSITGTNASASGYNFSLNGARGTGTGIGGDIIFRTAPAGSTGTTQNPHVDVMTIKGSGVVNIANIPTSSAGLSSGDIYSNAGILTIVP